MTVTECMTGGQVIWSEVRGQTLHSAATCYERLHGSSHCFSFSDGSVDEIQEVGVGMTGVKICCFTGVNHRAAAHRHKHIKGMGFGECNGVFKTGTRAKR